jgi:hypothetical protein
MVCRARTKGVTLRHDLLLGAWRRIAHRAGVATAVEPAMSRLRARTAQPTRERGDLLAVLPEAGLVVADVSVVHPAAMTYARNASRTDGAAAAARDQEKRLKYGVGSQVATHGFTPLSTETYGRMGAPAHAFLKDLASAAASSAAAGFEVTTSAFKAGALRELGTALVRGNEVVYREALCVYARAGGTAARPGAAVPTVEGDD